ncbi:hypothetical protein D0T49_04265 [Paludibacter sp. 221]|uniref:hypothetical protein n=1 Tax=Paludibacter sp. 221 TaxID=2302939 RepID=UPI0013D22C31|nr:hypothetical protein [Paludibacter sp. 221]NDV46254.1 hypothetical protein [Paludibacter sp. 221]
MGETFRIKLDKQTFAFKAQAAISAKSKESFIKAMVETNGHIKADKAKFEKALGDAYDTIVAKKKST